jgi:integrase
MNDWRESWEGGRTYWDSKRGRLVYLIEKQRDKVRYTIPLDAEGPDAARTELSRFEDDPVAYKNELERAAERFIAEATEQAGALLIDAENVAGFQAFLRGKKGDGEKYIKNTTTYLAAWGKVLATKNARDLRYATLDHLQDSLATWETAEKKRIIAIKSFCTWLEIRRGEVTRLKAAENASRGLKVPKAEKSKKSRGYDMKYVESVYAAIDTWPVKGKYAVKEPDVEGIQAVRDVFYISAATGMHYPEIERIAEQDEDCVVIELQKFGRIAGVLETKHKSKDTHRHSVDARTLAAAKRLVARGRAPDESWCRKVLKRAAEKLGDDEPLKIGELRHSYATWLAECGKAIHPKATGLTLAEVQAAMGHAEGSKVTRRHYLNVKVPPLYHVPVKLKNKNDPD